MSIRSGFESSMYLGWTAHEPLKNFRPLTVIQSMKNCKCEDEWSISGGGQSATLIIDRRTAWSGVHWDRNSCDGTRHTYLISLPPLSSNQHTANGQIYFDIYLSTTLRLLIKYRARSSSLPLTFSRPLCLLMFWRWLTAEMRSHLSIRRT